ncbi:hypothetical protein MAR_031914 [Mya arenaria]|uniref:Uncharacterized protein n=1 Tax=Mya arenaria TaxID=6604 RepID=A0ABY7F617_MYAAR|nr:hypothetical protein MAR_031914 [Mya arenaria]
MTIVVDCTVQKCIDPLVETSSISLCERKWEFFIIKWFAVLMKAKPLFSVGSRNKDCGNACCTGEAPRERQYEHALHVAYSLSIKMLVSKWSVHVDNSIASFALRRLIKRAVSVWNLKL